MVNASYFKFHLCLLCTRTNTEGGLLIFPPVSLCSFNNLYLCLQLEVLCVSRVGQHTQALPRICISFLKSVKGKSYILVLVQFKRCSELCFCAMQVMLSLNMSRLESSVTNVSVKLTERMQNYHCRALPLVL